MDRRVGVTRGETFGMAVVEADLDGYDLVALERIEDQDELISRVNGIDADLFVDRWSRPVLPDGCLVHVTPDGLLRLLRRGLVRIHVEEVDALPGEMTAAIALACYRPLPVHKDDMLTQKLWGTYDEMADQVRDRVSGSHWDSPEELARRFGDNGRPLSYGGYLDV